MSRTVVNVALPDIQKELGASFQDLQWVVDAYALALAALLLASGSIGHLLGRRRVFVAGLLLFVTASLLCGLAGSPTMLNVSRGLQGIGGAMMFATSLALIAQEFAPNERGTAFGIWGATTGFAVAVGPLVGGALTDACRSPSATRTPGSTGPGCSPSARASSAWSWRSSAAMTRAGPAPRSSRSRCTRRCSRCSISLLSFLAAPIAGKLAERFPVRAFLGTGLLCVGGGLLLMSGIDPSDDWTTLLAGFIVSGVGIGLINPPLRKRPPECGCTPSAASP